jgi:hypothetical protein
MPPKKNPEVIELDRYRKAQEQRAAEAAAKAKAARRPERFLGSRRNAGWFLILVLVLLAVLFVAPRFLPF